MSLEDIGRVDSPFKIRRLTRKEIDSVCRADMDEKEANACTKSSPIATKECRGGGRDESRSFCNSKNEDADAEIVAEYSEVKSESKRASRRDKKRGRLHELAVSSEEEKPKSSRRTIGTNCDIETEEMRSERM